MRKRCEEARKRKKEAKRKRKEEAIRKTTQLLPKVSRFLEVANANDKHRFCSLFPSKTPAPLEGKTPYEVLGVPREATEVQLKKQVKSLSLLFHPDKNKHALSTAMFQSIRVAYTRVLKERNYIVK